MIRFIIIILFFNLGFVFPQQQDKIDFLNAKVDIQPQITSKTIEGRVVYEFTVLQNVDSVFLNAMNIEFSSVLIDDRKAKYKTTDTAITVYKKLKKGKTYSIALKYLAKPKQTVYFIDNDVSLSAPRLPAGRVEGQTLNAGKQIWTQGQGKYTSHWLPSFDDMTEKVEFDMNITFDSTYEVIANGKLQNVVENDGLKTWSFDMQKPMSSYLLAFVIGDYDKQQLTSTSGIPIENHYYPKDSLRVESTYRYTKEIFDFLEREIGVPYPWQNYKQIPVRDFLYAGMENTGTTIFSDDYVIDSIAFVDKNYVNVNAHEMAHQWFGNLVTEKNGNHHWLHEGFATYYAYLAEKELFGEEYFYWKLYNTANQLERISKEGKGEALTNPKASSLTFYEKGAWALVMLREEIGDRDFKKGIKNYLEKHRFKNVTIPDFLMKMEEASGQNLSKFKKKWLEQTEFPYKSARYLLQRQSASLKTLFSMEDDLHAAQSDDLDYANYWNSTKSIHLKKHILDQYWPVLPDSLVDIAFDSDTIPIRQSLAVKMDSVPIGQKAKFETLLDDKSYVTKENALIKLWISYPENRHEYLNRTNTIIGMPNKNMRLLWLTLAILTNGYDSLNTRNYFQELTGYTSPMNGWQTRMAAFQYLSDGFGLNNEGLKNLFNGCTHHSWQFRKYARNLLDELLQDDDYKTRIHGLAKELKGEERSYIKSKIEKQ